MNTSSLLFWALVRDGISVEMAKAISTNNIETDRHEAWKVLLRYAYYSPRSFSSNERYFTFRILTRKGWLTGVAEYRQPVRNCTGSGPQDYYCDGLRLLQAKPECRWDSVPQELRPVR